MLPVEVDEIVLSCEVDRFGIPFFPGVTLLLILFGKTLKLSRLRLDLLESDDSLLFLCSGFGGFHLRRFVEGCERPE